MTYKRTLIIQQRLERDKNMTYYIVIELSEFTLYSTGIFVLIARYSWFPYCKFKKCYISCMHSKRVFIMKCHNS